MNRYADEKTYLEFNDGIKIQFLIFTEKRSELNARHAIDDKNDLMLAENNVIIKIQRVYFRNEKLNWDRNKKIFIMNC